MIYNIFDKEIIIIILIGVLIYQILSNKSNIKNYSDENNSDKNNSDKNNSKNLFSWKSFFNRFDTNLIYNPFSPPERRTPQYNYSKLPSIHTRGYPDNYSLQGILSRPEDGKILQLYGRQKYPGSDQWEYYAIGKDSGNFTAKLPVDSNNDKELYDNDTIKLPYLDGGNSDFIVKLYDYNEPKYYPVV